MRAFLRKHLPFIAIVLPLILVMTWPTAAHVLDGSRMMLPSTSHDVWKSFWDAWHGRAALEGSSDYWFSEVLFYPTGVSMVYYPFVVPHMLVFGALQTVMPVFNAFNLVYLLIVVVCALCAYVYLSYLLKDRWLAAPGAVIFGCSHLVVATGQDPVLQLIAPVPLALYFLQRGITEERRAFVAAAGITIGLTGFISPYILICLVITVGLFLPYYTYSRWRDAQYWRRMLLLASLVAALSLLCFYPMLAHRGGMDSALSKHFGLDFGNDLISYFVNYRHPLLSPVFHAVFDLPPLELAADTAHRVNGWNHASYLGYLPLLLIAFGLLRRGSRRRMWLWLLIIAPFLVLRLGATLRINDQVFEGVLLPKYYLNHLSPAVFGVFYETDNFMMGVALPLAVLACYGLCAALKGMSPRRRRLLALAATLIIAFEYYYLPFQMQVTDQELAFIDWLQSEDDQDSIRLINLPMDQYNSKVYMFHQSLHGYPQVEGRAGRTPPEAYNYINANAALSAWYANKATICTLAQTDAHLQALDDLRRDGFSHVILHPQQWRAEDFRLHFARIPPAFHNEHTTVFRLQELRQFCAQPDPQRELVDLYRAFLDGAQPSYEALLSYHPDTKMVLYTQEYLAQLVTGWKSFSHISQDAHGGMQLRGSDPNAGELDSLLAQNDSFWLLQDGRQSPLSASPLPNERMTRGFHVCLRARDEAALTVDYFVRKSIPCALVNADEPLAIDFDDGSQLRNAHAVVNGGALDIHLDWTPAPVDSSAYSIQVFDGAGAKAAQLDAVMFREPLASHRVETADFAPGEYRALLILYDYETRKSYGGSVVATGQRFEREIEIARFSLGA